MESSGAAATPARAPGERIGSMLGRRPALTAAGVLAVLLLALIAKEGLHEVAQTGLNGLSLGSIYALGAVGLTLVYGILRLVNFSHGDLLTFGAYIAFVVNVTWDLPFGLSILAAVAATAALALVLEAIIWRPMRGKQA